MFVADSSFPAHMAIAGMNLNWEITAVGELMRLGRMLKSDQFKNGDADLVRN